MVRQYEIYWVELNPTVGREINKTRPCVIITPDIFNKKLGTVLVAPITSTIRDFPTRVNITIDNKNGQVALDQIRCIDKTRIQNKLVSLSKKEIIQLKETLAEFLIK